MHLDEEKIEYLMEKQPEKIVEFIKKSYRDNPDEVERLIEYVKSNYGGYIPSKKKYEEFYSFICRKEEEEIKRVHTDVHKFTLKFDYRNHGSAWGTEIDAPVRGVEKLSGYTENPNKQK